MHNVLDFVDMEPSAEGSDVLSTSFLRGHVSVCITIVMVQNKYCHLECMFRGTGIRLMFKAKITSRLRLKLIK
jgi:hypothetical protein